jgi:Trehalose-phosphatase
MKELKSLLKDVFCNFDVNIRSTKGSLEVKTKIDSQSLITKIMTKISYIRPVDFVFTIGNEERYKDVFSFLDNKRNYSQYLAPKCTSVCLSQKNQHSVQAILMKFLEEV